MRTSRANIVRTKDWVTRASPATAMADAAHLGRDAIGPGEDDPAHADGHVLGVDADDAALADIDVGRLDVGDAALA